MTDHIHERESAYQLSKLLSTSSPETPFKLSFIPSVAPWFSGIISVLNAPLKKQVRADDIWALYEEKYGNEPLIKISKQVPNVIEASGKHGWRVGGIQVHSDLNRVVVVVSCVSRSVWNPCSLSPVSHWVSQGALDNLLKGAATQCMQNLNLALGYDELSGIPTDAY